MNTEDFERRPPVSPSKFLNSVRIWIISIVIMMGLLAGALMLIMRERVWFAIGCCAVIIIVYFGAFKLTEKDARSS